MKQMARLIAVLVLLLSPSLAEAEPVKLLLAIGANVGDPDDPPLKYATKDAERVRRVFVELGGVRSDRAYLVLDQPANKVRERLAEISGRIAELRAAGKDVVLIIYASAHAKAGVLHLMGTHLPLRELRQFASGSGARLRLLVIDACDSGVVARRKGGSAGPAYDVQLERLPLRGEVVITSSGPAQASEEWESLRGSLFTHHLITGLRGDADSENDGRITLAEAYAYSYRRTVAEAARTGQHPAFDLDLIGTGELVLTEPAVARSAVVFPSESSGRYVLASQPRADVLAEVDKTPGKPLRIAVPPGRYLLRKRTGRRTGLLEVELPFGGTRTVHDRDLKFRDFAEVAMKGDRLELKPWLVFGGASLQSPPIEATGPRILGMLGARRTFSEWFVAGRLAGTLASYQGVGLTIRERSMALTATAGHRWLSLPVIPWAGLSAELLGMHQTIERDREQEIRRLPGAGPVPPRLVLAPGVGPSLGLEIPGPFDFVGLLQADLLVRHLEVENDALPIHVAFGITAAVAWRF